MTARVGLLSEVERELARLPRPEEVAVRTVILKLEALGSRLPYPIKVPCAAVPRISASSALVR